MRGALARVLLKLSCDDLLDRYVDRFRTWVHKACFGVYMGNRLTFASCFFPKIEHSRVLAFDGAMHRINLLFKLHPVAQSIAYATCAGTGGMVGAAGGIYATSAFTEPSGYSSVEFVKAIGGAAVGGTLGAVGAVAALYYWPIVLPVSALYSGWVQRTMVPEEPCS